jgi:DNA polymerase (family X)
MRTSETRLICKDAFGDNTYLLGRMSESSVSSGQTRQSCAGLGLFDFEVASAFYEVARLLLIMGENEHRANAYYRAAVTLDGYEKRVWRLANEGTLEQLPGIGKGIVSRSRELLEFGSLPLLDELRARVPDWLLNIANARGLGWKTLSELYRSGAKVPSDILSTTERSNSSKLSERTRGLVHRCLSDTQPLAMQLAHADLIAGEMMAWLHPFCAEVQPSGALRRREDTIAAMELMLRSAETVAVMNRVQASRLVTDASAVSASTVRAMTRLGVPFLITVAHSPAEFQWRWFLQTSTKPHLRLLAERFAGTDSDLSIIFLSDLPDAAILAARRPVECETDIYASVCLPYIPPEIRQGSGELELAARGNLNQLLQSSQVISDLHMHTRWSDGINSISEMAVAAENQGYQYIAVTDHSISLRIANGLGVERLLRQIEEITNWNKTHANLKILKGIEVDILQDGKLDLPDHVLSKLDWVVASIHTATNLPENQMMARLEGALRNPHVHAIAHPTGRLLGKPGQIFYHREPYRVDIDRLISLCAKHGKGLEMNCFPERMDLSSELARRAASFGVKLHLGTDAHSAEHLPLMRFGVDLARRAMLTAQSVRNCESWDSIVSSRDARPMKRSIAPKGKSPSGALGLRWDNRPRNVNRFFRATPGIRNGSFRSVGIDLTAGKARGTGWALLQGTNSETQILASDDDIISATVAAHPDVVSIDSPLSLPKGRCCAIETCECRAFGIVRTCERSLMRMRIGVFPALLPSMAKLTLRGIAIAERLKRRGLNVIESYPGAAQDMLGISRKGRGVDLLMDGLRNFGISLPRRELTHDELDAITSALVGYFWHSGEYLGLGAAEENELIVPRIPKFKEGQNSIVLGLAGLPATGKTTVGEYLAFKYGFRYRRYSSLLARMFEEKCGHRPTRGELQSFGYEMHVELGPEGLTQKLIQTITPDENCVIDGLRHLGDYETLRGCFGNRFHFVFIEAAEKNRLKRMNADGSRAALQAPDAHPVEAEVPLLGFRTPLRIENNHSFKALFSLVDQLLGAT